MSHISVSRPRRGRHHRRAGVLLATAALAACAPRARATDTYVGPSGNWSTAGNWSLGAVPGNNETVVLQGIIGGANTVTFDAPAAAATNLAALTVAGATGTGSVTLLQSAG